MAKPADIGSKRLIGLDPDGWVRWITQRPDVRARGILAATEFQWMSRETDAIIHAFSPQEGEFLMVNDMQLRCDQGMAWRTQAYSALAEEKYRLPVYPVVVNLLPPGPNVVIAERYEHTLFGLTARRDFRVINLSGGGRGPGVSHAAAAAAAICAAAGGAAARKRWCGGPH
ncbi:MAG: Rpn family recombination-promoting nuclease/putative transposase, partial [Chloroflexaceae bacterium]|nr:Rpn family recombination-promoting nuclease/putative transposase [Chloroflexaceae bacterium]